MHDYLTITLVIIVYFSPALFQIYLLIKEEDQKRKLILKKFFKLLKISIPLFIFILFIINLLNHTNYLNYSKPIHYKNINQITFRDFKGLEFFHKEFEGSTQFAYIVTSIDHHFDNDSLAIYALFHPSRSFVYDRNIENKDLLSHELYHFKITELFTRKVRRDISKCNEITKKHVKEKIREYWKKERLFQKKYDYDTYHSYIYGQQKKYERKIDSLLYLLNNFKTPKVYLNVKD